MLCDDGINRRGFLRCAAGAAAGGLALRGACSLAASVHGGYPLAPKTSHFPAKAKHLVVIFLTGGFSHVDTFDPKPLLKQAHGKIAAKHLPGGFPNLPGDNSKLPLMGSPFAFQQHGESGIWVSEIFPRLSTVVDDLCVIRSMNTDFVEHNQSILAMHTGSATVPMPSIGSWLSYGLGTLNPNLPPYVILVENLPYGGTQALDNNFLPPVHQGVRIVPGPTPIANLKPPEGSLTLKELERRMLRDANELHSAARPEDLNLRAAINSFDIAEGMMRVGPDAFDTSQESASTLKMYGISNGDNKSIGWQCLMVRRLIERGVRVVELIDTGSRNNWDAHEDILYHRPIAGRIDQPLSALITDLKQQGLLDDTLVAICTEFGRTPWYEDPKGNGRNHYGRAFTCLLVGAGVKGGVTYGETDDYGVNITADPCHVHDYHATILHLMGIDHTRLTYRYAGRNFRLTDVHGTVVEKILS